MLKEWAERNFSGAYRQARPIRARPLDGIILCCVDSRFSPQVLADLDTTDPDSPNFAVVKNPGPIITRKFVARLEGQVLRNEVALVVVMVHERCGAGGIAQGVLRGERGEFSPIVYEHVQSIVEHGRNSAALSGEGMSEREFLKEHARSSIQDLKRWSHIIDSAVCEGRLLLVPAIIEADTFRIIPFSAESLLEADGADGMLWNFEAAAHPNVMAARSSLYRLLERNRVVSERAKTVGLKPPARQELKGCILTHETSPFPFTAVLGEKEQAGLPGSMMVGRYAKRNIGSAEVATAEIAMHYGANVFLLPESSDAHGSASRALQQAEENCRILFETSHSIREKAISGEIEVALSSFDENCRITEVRRPELDGWR